MLASLFRSRGIQISFDSTQCGGRMTRGMKVARKNDQQLPKASIRPSRARAPTDNSRAATTRIGRPLSFLRPNSKPQQPYDKDGLLTTTRRTRNSARPASLLIFVRASRTCSTCSQVGSNNLLQQNLRDLHQMS